MREFASMARAAGEMQRTELSLVIPVFNAAATIEWLVEQIHVDFEGVDFDLVLVNDGSADSSEEVCLRLVQKFPDTVRYVHLARNYGEHTAVLAGLRQTRGRFVAILDDDGQNPPHEARRMFEHAWRHDFDVVYGRYEFRKHSMFRRAGSWFNDLVAGLVLDKPRGIHLSSFKVMSRMVVDELVKYDGKFPYLDGMIFRITQNVDELAVSHLPRRAGRSGYNLRKLIALWMNMFLGFSMFPLRGGARVGRHTVGDWHAGARGNGRESLERSSVGGQPAIADGEHRRFCRRPFPHACDAGRVHGPVLSRAQWHAAVCGAVRAARCRGRLPARRRAGFS